MDDKRKQAVGVQFDGKLKLEFHGAQMKSDVVLLPQCSLGLGSS
jgi:hypothetical protein